MMESRALRLVTEYRSGAGQSFRVTGYASRTETPYSVADFLGIYRETIARGAFAGVLRDDVRLLVNHDGIPLARTSSGTLRLAEDSTGLLVEADVDGSTPMGSQLRSALDRGDMSQMSFAFDVDPAGQHWDAAYTDRLITRIAHLFDVSAVTYPANPATSVGIGA